MYKNMYIKLNGVYFFKYPEYNFITIAYLYSAVVGPVRLWRNLCACGGTCAPVAELVRLWRIASFFKISESLAFLYYSEIFNWLRFCSLKFCCIGCEKSSFIGTFSKIDTLTT
jgi:hypothetical protein